MTKLINLVVIIFSLLLLTNNALAVPVCTPGGGSITSPLSAGREFGPNQWELIQYTNSQNQPASSFGFMKGALSGFLYNGTPGGIVGFSDRHVLEGVILNSGATPSTCNTPITQGTTGPCPNNDYVPDACPDLDPILGQSLEYPYRAFGSPNTYATIVWGATANNLADVGTISIANLALDFKGPATSPPFQAGAFDSQIPNVAVNPYTGPLTAGDTVLIETPSGPAFGSIDHVANQLTSVSPSSDPHNPAYHLYKTTLVGGKFIDVKSPIIDLGRSGSPVYTANTVDAQGHPCYQLIGTLESAGQTLFGTRVVMYQSFASNIQPALLAASGKTYTPTGSCTAVGPKSPNGNIDNNGFTQNTPCNIDLAMAAQTNIFNMLQSKCTAPSGHTCGTNTWASVIQTALLHPEDGYVDIGYSNLVTDITHPFLHVTYACINLSECDPNALKTSMLAKTNSTGTTLATALTNWAIAVPTAAQMITMAPTYPTTEKGIVSNYQN